MNDRSIGLWAISPYMVYHAYQWHFILRIDLSWLLINCLCLYSRVHSQDLGWISEVQGGTCFPQQDRAVMAPEWYLPHAINGLGLRVSFSFEIYWISKERSSQNSYLENLLTARHLFLEFFQHVIPTPFPHTLPRILVRRSWMNRPC